MQGEMEAAEFGGRDLEANKTGDKRVTTVKKRGCEVGE
jgi:hypothetical protein